MVLQLGHPSVEHLREVQSQDVVQHQLRPRHHPHLLGQGLHVPDQDLESDVDWRVEDEMKRYGSTLETPLLRVYLLQREVGQWMHHAEIGRGKAHQLRVPVVQNPLQGWQQDVQSHAVHPVEVQPHPPRQLPHGLPRTPALFGRFWFGGFSGRTASAGHDPSVCGQISASSSCTCFVVVPF